MALSTNFTRVNCRCCLGTPRLARRNRLSITTILKALKVPCKIKRPFFVCNEANLEYIYYDFEKAARRALANAHPDVGGNTENFQNLLQHIQMARRSFGRNGIGAEKDRYNKSHYNNSRFWVEHNMRWKEAMAMYASLRYLMRKDGAL